jgi:hypothetical protein
MFGMEEFSAIDTYNMPEHLRVITLEPEFSRNESCSQKMAEV